VVDHVHVPEEAFLRDLEEVDPQGAALLRQQTAEAIAISKEHVLTRTIARVHTMIVEQEGCPKRA